MNRSSHPGDDLQLLLDGLLPPERRADVEAHVAQCPRCGRELDVLRRVKHTLREGLPEQAVPPHVTERVMGALAAEMPAERTPASRPRTGRPAVAVGLAIAAALAVLLVWARASRQDFVHAAAGDFARYRSGALVVELETADPGQLEHFFAQRAVQFATRVFDFGMMGYRLTGGTVQRLGGRTSVLFTYQGTDTGSLVCQMYQGTTGELPTPTDRRVHGEIEFLVYRVEAVTLVFWQEGTVVCVLAADGDPEQAIQLAHAKAIKVPPPS